MRESLFLFEQDQKTVLNAGMMAEKLQIEKWETLLHAPLVQERIARIPYAFAKHKTLLPIEETPDELVIAMSDLLDLEAVHEVRLLVRKKIRVVFSPKERIEEAIERCYHQKDEETQELFSNLQRQETSQHSDEGYDLLEKSDQNPIVRLVNTILVEAIQQQASDIHFEPAEEGLVIRYRIDGVLLKRHTPPREYQSQILTRLKVMAQMDIAEKRLPQDGRIKLRHGGREIDFRVSTLPIAHGERVVLRILDKGNVLLGLSRIGMEETVLRSFRKWIDQPEGIILVTGPTGSGKTTTLYSALTEMNVPELNIITVEDPVEYKLPGISQLNVNPRIELTFAKGLRHILRQDPDVIMIGEIRDRETAEIAIQSSLTGHLVISTLHTNDAPSALTRLADMGIEPYLLASSILGVLAQRLLRSICPFCKVFYVPSKEELSELGLSRSLRVKLCKGEGCEQCFGTGYKGRQGIYELMPVQACIKTQVLKSQDAEELRKIALKEGMVSLFDQGVSAVLKGMTTSAEVLRVTRMDAERVSHASV